MQDTLGPGHAILCHKLRVKDMTLAINCDPVTIKRYATIQNTQYTTLHMIVYDNVHEDMRTCEGLPCGTTWGRAARVSMILVPNLHRAVKVPSPPAIIHLPHHSALTPGTDKFMIHEK